MKPLRTTLCAAIAATLALPAGAGAARNPYTAERVCGTGYKAIDRHRLTTTSRETDRRVLLATVVLTYNARLGKTCAVTLKRWRAGKDAPGFGDHLAVSLAARPLGARTANGDAGEFKWYAGPAYVPARGRCVQWGGEATLLVPATWERRGSFKSAYRSRWEHCG